MPKREVIVEFSEIFEFAEKEFKMHWNQCCDVFYSGHETIQSPETQNKHAYLGDCESELEWLRENKDHKYYNDNKAKTLEVLVAFMKDKKLKEMLILND